MVTGNFRDSWGGQSLNQADHIAVGRGVLDAARDAGNRWIFPEQLDGDLEPWGGVARCGRPGHPRPGTRSTPPTRSTPGSRRWRPTGPTSTGSGWEDFDPREFLEGMARQTGQGLGVAFAAPFEVYPLGWGD